MKKHAANLRPNTSFDRQMYVALAAFTACLTWWCAGRLLACPPARCSEAQIKALIARSEGLLARARPDAAVVIAAKAGYALMATENVNEELYDRQTVAYCTARVRLGHRGLPNEATARQRELLVGCERELRDIARKQPTLASRHGEALVALPDRTEEALALLTSLHERGSLEEAEGYAALSRAASSLGHVALSDMARRECAKRAKKLSKKVCLVASPRE